MSTIQPAFFSPLFQKNLLETGNHTYLTYNERKRQCTRLNFHLLFTCVGQFTLSQFSYYVFPLHCSCIAALLQPTLSCGVICFPPFFIDQCASKRPNINRNYKHCQDEKWKNSSSKTIGQGKLSYRIKMLLISCIQKGNIQYLLLKSVSALLNT